MSIFALWGFRWWKKTIYFWFGTCSHVNFFLCWTISGGRNTKQTNKTKSIVPRGIKSEVSLQKQTAPRQHLERGKVSTNDTSLMFTKKQYHLSSHNLFTAWKDRLYHSALWGEDVCWSPLCLPLTFADIMSLAEESGLAFDAVLSSVILFVSSFHICCISAGLRLPETWNKTHSLLCL